MLQTKPQTFPSTTFPIHCLLQSHCLTLIVRAADSLLGKLQQTDTRIFWEGPENRCEHNKQSNKNYYINNSYKLNLLLNIVTNGIKALASGIRFVFLGQRILPPGGSAICDTLHYLIVDEAL
jgi:hypothetical protein